MMGGSYRRLFPSYPRPPKMASTVHEVIILGAGIMGSCAAYHSARASLRPLVVEQFARGHSKGSSHGQSRIIRYSHGDETYLPMMKESYQLWNELEEVTGKSLINKCGLLRVADEKSVKNYAKILKEYGVNHQLLKGDEIKNTYPQFQYGAGWHGLLDVDAGIIFADRCMAAAQEEAAKNGATFRFEEKVTAIRSESESVVVETTMGLYNTKSLIVTAGGWLKKVLPGMDNLVHTQAEQIGTLYWTIKSNNEHFDVNRNKCPTVVIEDGEHKMFMIPPVDYPNQIKLCLDSCVAIDPDQPLQKLPEWMQDVVAKHITQYMPDIDASKPSKIDLCVYTMTKDSHYAIGRYPSDPRILIAGGFSGSGFKLAISVGRMLKDLAQGADAGIVPELFSLTRNRVAKH
uniref:Sarcosine oxidasee (formaldehyde-forming) n=1 Tax=Steinernema glaseri TaxID=37863 RepID=A0A1I7ZLI9_9BILA